MEWLVEPANYSNDQKSDDIYEGIIGPILIIAGLCLIEEILCKHLCVVHCTFTPK
jgi:hypothetical protein